MHDDMNYLENNQTCKLVNILNKKKTLKNK